MLQRIGTELKPALAYLRRRNGNCRTQCNSRFCHAFRIRNCRRIKAASRSLRAHANRSRYSGRPRSPSHPHKPECCASRNRRHGEPVCRRGDRSRGRLRAPAREGCRAHRGGRAGGVRRRSPQATRSSAQAIAATAQFDAAAAAAEAATALRARKIKTGKPHRKTYAELAPEATLMAKRIYQAAQNNGERITLREISAKLASVGYLQANRKPFPSGGNSPDAEGPMAAQSRA